ncbi:response regulator [Hyphomicrobium facile]|uniref:DNA-binding response regulator, NarL/FixJ family, contains REC and HTH domains n=1 Tax=Hyphomicrobium facile TaxID=51670 RepID=A0A1I7NQN4_9HYPH|nr:response regulator transcription factor [Hyphomicrobium facile]SFV37001.1 DNA-binding response regulator, NarL/FixJ family, contains REC and HTH domains [Hyphomicrobium facile]
MANVRVAVIDDHPLLRAGVIHSLKTAGDFDVVAEGGSAHDAIAIAQNLRPDAILLDVNMPGLGLEAALQISKAHPNIRLIMLTICDLDDCVATCLEAGVAGYVLKGTSPAELARVVRSVCEGESYVTPALAARILTKIRVRTAPKAKAQSPQNDLTSREEAVLDQLALGLKNKEIARVLSLSEKTVKHYMTSIMQKLQVRSRLEAALRVKERSV